MRSLAGCATEHTLTVSCGFGPQHGTRMWIETLLSDLAFEDNNNESWIPDRPLGGSAFGSVTRWCKRDQYGDTIDTIAMKETNPAEDHASGFWSRRGLAKEALFQSQLTNDYPECVINLRGYRYYTKESKSRFYMEHAKYGTLEHTRRWHRAWDTYLPEVFLWTIFHELALAVEAMEQCPKSWTPFSLHNMDQPRPLSHLLHFDLKPANVFLCERQRKDPDTIFPSEYPQVKVGDFGVMERTWDAQVRNPPEDDDPFHSEFLGAEVSQTPEQRGWGLDFDGRVNPPVNFGYNRQAGFQFEPRQNVWQVGLIMLDLMQLNNLGDVADLLEQRETEGSYLRNMGNSQIPRRHFIDRTTSQNTTEYSHRLRTMIWICLYPDINRRPTPTQLVNQTRGGLRDSLQQNRERRRPRIRRARVPPVALTPAAMNELPHGANSLQNHPCNARNADEGVEWADMRNQIYHDADQPLIHPPKPKFNAFYRNEGGTERRPEVVWESWARIGEQNHPIDPKAPRKLATRIRDFDGADMDNIPLRDVLLRIKPAVRTFAGAKPMNMVEYVLQKEKMDEAETQLVLSWLYNDAQADDNWRWEGNDDFGQKATLVHQKVDFMDWTFKECLYVVTTTGFGVEHVDAAVDALKAIYGSG